MASSTTPTSAASSNENDNDNDDTITTSTTTSMNTANNEHQHQQQEESSPPNCVNNNDHNQNNNNVLRGTLLTLVLKIVSFVATQATYRVLDPSTLGKASVQLELLLTTVLFISREGFRLALTKNNNNGDGDDKTTTTTNKNAAAVANWNVAWLTIPVTTIVSGSALLWHLFSSSSSSTSTTAEEDIDYDYRMAGILFCVASWIEGCAEPAVLLFLRRLDVPKRASAESLAAVTKTFAIVLALRFINVLESRPVTAFGLAQIVYALTYAGYLYYKAITITTTTTTSTTSDGDNQFHGPNFTVRPLLDYATCRMTLLFTIQGFFKHVLTEADKIVLTAVADNYNQGVYAMGSAYGGMAARILLQPLEENARLLWSRLAVATSSTSTSYNKNNNNDANDATNKKNNNNQKSGGDDDDNNDNDNTTKNLIVLKRSYTTLVKLVLYLGLLFSCIAVNYTNLLLCILAGRKWGKVTEAANVLSAFCIYTAFLAMNGMTEAFVYGVANSANELTKLGLAHTVTGIIFALCAPSLVTVKGTVGLVMANCVAMSIRSIYSIQFAANYFAKHEKGDSTLTSSCFWSTVKEISPHPIVLASFVMAYLMTNWSFHQVADRDLHQVLDIRDKEWLYWTGQHVAVGISSAIGVVTMAMSVERPFLASLKSMIVDRQRRPKKKQD